MPCTLPLPGEGTTCAIADGFLALQFECCRDGVTRLAERAQRFPLRFTTPLYLDPGDPGMAWVYVQNPTGGIFAGDRLGIRVEAGPGARVHLTTQSATKLYRMDGCEARQTVELVVRDGAFVEYAPDLMIPQAGSSLTQRTSVRLGEGASFIGVELVAPGRLARGEAFEYERVDLTFEASDRRSVLVVDTLVLEPWRRSPARRGLLGSRPYVGTLMVLAPGRDAETLAALLDAEVPKVAAGGALPGGAGSFARILAPSAPSLRHAVTALWNVARMHVAGRGLPRRRK